MKPLEYNCYWSYTGCITHDLCSVPVLYYVVFSALEPTRALHVQHRNTNKQLIQ